MWYSHVKKKKHVLFLSDPLSEGGQELGRMLWEKEDRKLEELSILCMDYRVPVLDVFDAIGEGELVSYPYSRWEKGFYRDEFEAWAKKRKKLNGKSIGQAVKEKRLIRLSRTSAMSFLLFDEVLEAVEQKRGDVESYRDYEYYLWEFREFLKRYEKKEKVNHTIKRELIILSEGCRLNLVSGDEVVGAVKRGELIVYPCDLVGMWFDIKEFNEWAKELKEKAKLEKTTK